MITEQLDIYLPDEAGRRPAILILPGGGYSRHAPHESEPVAEWLNSLGIAAFVLRYRVSPHRYPAPLDDGWAALEFIRNHESVDSSRVGVLGFSAGGHLAGLLATGTDQPRPALAVLCYPVISLEDGMNLGSAANLLGPDASEELRRSLSVHRRVDDKTPPSFVWHTADDAGVSLDNSLMVTQALSANGVPVELHVYPHGKHGLGLATGERAEEWTTSCARWLSIQLMVEARFDKSSDTNVDTK